MAIVRIILLLGVAYSHILFANGEFTEDADLFFAEYVRDDGVDYRALRVHKLVLENLTKQIANTKDIEKWADNQQKAFYLNAYNVLTIASILKHFPVRTPRTIAGLFSRQKHRVAGENITLVTLQDRFQRQFRDPRAHFALVCAARGCPPIQPRAYKADGLDKQLDQLMTWVMLTGVHVIFDPRTQVLYLSKIFEWNARDIALTDRGRVSLVKYYTGWKMGRDVVVSFLDYDWDLNDTLKPCFEKGECGRDNSEQAFTDFSRMPVIKAPLQLMKKVRFPKKEAESESRKTRDAQATAVALKEDQRKKMEAHRLRLVEEKSQAQRLAFERKNKEQATLIESLRTAQKAAEAARLRAEKAVVVAEGKNIEMAKRAQERQGVAAAEMIAFRHASEKERQRDVAQAAEDARILATRQAAEKARRTAERHLNDEERLAAARKLADDARLVEEKAIAQEKRLAKERRLANEVRIEKARKEAEKARLIKERRAAEDKRLEKERLEAEDKRLELERLAAAEKRLEIKRLAAAEKRLEMERQEADAARIESERNAAAAEAHKENERQIVEAARRASARKEAEDGRRENKRRAAKESQLAAAEQRAEATELANQRRAIAQARAQAQRNRHQQRPENDEEPSVRSGSGLAAPGDLLAVKVLAMQLSNELYSQIATFDAEGQEEEKAARISLLASVFEARYGFRERVTVGVEATFRAVRVHETDASRFSVLTFGDDRPSLSSWTRLGFSIMGLPMVKLPHLTLKTLFLLPMDDTSEGIKGKTPWLDWKDYRWWTRAFYHMTQIPFVIVDASLGVFIRFDTTAINAKNEIATPLKLMASRDLPKRIRVFSFFEWSPKWFGKTLVEAYALQVGFGGQWQVIDDLSVNLLLSYFPMGKNEGAGSIVNLGGRWKYSF